MTEQVTLFNIKPKIMVSKNIAVVGNSDRLLKKDYSRKINEYEDVIRFNFADIKNRFTGNKTTIRWVNCNINIKAAKEHNKEVTNVGKLKEYINKHFSGIKIVAWDSLKQKLLEFNPKIVVHRPNGLCTLKNINRYLETIGVENRFEEREKCWPRTGFHAIMTCIRSGCTPHLYGFDLSKRSQIWHYSLNQTYVVDNVKHHQINNEIDILNELLEKGFIVCH